MPTYQYKCTACLHEFEEFQSMSDDALTTCPKCRKRKLVRVISGAGLVFKGSGFYQTDYKSRGTPGGGTGRSKPAPAEGDSSAGAGKSTPEKGGGKEGGSQDGAGKKEKKNKTAGGDGPSGGKS